MVKKNESKLQFFQKGKSKNDKVIKVGDNEIEKVAGNILKYLLGKSLCIKFFLLFMTWDNDSKNKMNNQNWNN